MVAKQLNEAFDSNILKKFIAYAKEYTKKNNGYYEIRWCWASQTFDMFKIKPDGTVLKGTYRPSLSNLSDDNILGKKFYENSELPNVLKGRKATYNSIKSMTLGKEISFLFLIDYEEVRKNKDADVFAVMFINPEGTKQIYDASMKGIKRSNIKAEDEEKKKAFQTIRKLYDDYKKQNGDKAALELTDAVKKLVNNQDCIKTLNKMFNIQIDKETAAKYLYLFLLGYKEEWLRRPFERDERFMRLYDKFNEEE
jgi:hypothetical protein